MQTMSNYIHLIGAEDVSRAGYKMAEAADTMARAVSNLDDVLFRHRNYMEEWLERFERALESRRGAA